MPARLPVVLSAREWFPGRWRRRTRHRPRQDRPRQNPRAPSSTICFAGARRQLAATILVTVPQDMAPQRLSPRATHAVSEVRAERRAPSNSFRMRPRIAAASARARRMRTLPVQQAAQHGVGACRRELGGGRVQAQGRGTRSPISRQQPDAGGQSCQGANPPQEIHPGSVKA